MVEIFYQKDDGDTKEMFRPCKNSKILQIKMNTADMVTLSIRSLDSTIDIREDFLYDEETATVAFKPSTIQNTEKILYWRLPISYCGDKVKIFIADNHIRVTLDLFRS